MSLSLFVPRTRALTVDGRRYLCRRPSLSAVLLFLDLFDCEIGACMLADFAALSQAQLAEVLLPVMLVGDDATHKAAEVLALCVESSDGAGAVQERCETSRDLCIALSRAVLSLADIESIVTLSGVRERRAALLAKQAQGPRALTEDERADNADSEDDALAAVIVLSQECGLSIADTLALPVECVRKITDLLPSIMAARLHAQRVAATAPTSALARGQASAALLDTIPGISAQTVKDNG